ncbi:CIA30 family protein [Pelagibacterales bacterium]|nr:CIA30 family protein [Pelagibacterales bacterium]
MKNNKFLRLSLFLIFLVTISSNNFAETMFKDNFQEPNQWNYVADTVMGGVSTGGVEFKDIEGKTIALLTGNVTTENNGGFIQIRRYLRSINLEDINLIKLIAKGNNQKYFVFLRTTGTKLPWQYYQSEFTVNENFNEFILPINEFKKSGMLMSSKINPKKITSIGLVAFGRDHSAELFIKEIEFIK